MKLSLFLLCLLALSCGKNLVGEVENIKPSALSYFPDSIMFDTSIYADTTSSAPSLNIGSGTVVFEIVAPKIGALTIDKYTGEISVTNTISPDTYFIDVKVSNFVGSTQFQRALVLEVK